MMSSENRSAAGASAAPTRSMSPAGSSPDDAAQRPRRARTSKPKVKTGCNNCKQRRIKCDEKRPACANCLRSKKICTGYPPPARSARPFEEVRIAPKPIVAVSTPPPGREPIQLPPRRVAKYQRRSTPPLTPSPPVTAVMLHMPILLPFNTQEGMYFQLFREQTASELSGFFDSSFWARSVLQECHSEASIRHAVVALGALYKTLEKSSESPPASPTAMERDPTDNAYRHWEMAVKQYSNACNELMRASAADTGSNRTRLMASVLLACFDSFIGDHKQAIVQIQTGLGLLEQLRAERRRAFLPKPEEPVEEELIQMFTRLAIQAKSYDMAFHFPQPWVVRLTSSAQDPGSPGSDGTSPVSTHQDPIPERFSSIIEARIAWDTLCERIFRFTETMFAQNSSGVMGILPPSARHYGMRFKQDIEAWSTAFEHILVSRTAPGVSSQEKAGIAVLKMYQHMAQILFLMTFSDTESLFDKFIPEFKVIVDLGLEVVGDEERRAAMKRCPDPNFCRHRDRHEHGGFGGNDYTARHIKPSFSADLGIVPPLYVVATKCRDRTIRRQAIQLLQSSSRREGMWDSELTARIALWISEIEEDGEGDIDAGSSNLNTRASPLTPGSSPVQSQSRPSTSGSTARVNGSIDFGNTALGPGGNARWDTRRESVASSFKRSPQPPPQQQQKPRVIPEEKRVMVRAVEFDLRERFALVQLGSRDLPTGTLDVKTRVTKITW